MAKMYKGCAMPKNSTILGIIVKAAIAFMVIYAVMYVMDQYGILDAMVDWVIAQSTYNKPAYLNGGAP